MEIFLYNTDFEITSTEVMAQRTLLTYILMRIKGFIPKLNEGVTGSSCYDPIVYCTI